MRAIKTLLDVVDWRLCIGCGACAYACDKASVSMVHVETEGYRPTLDTDACTRCRSCLEFCPGAAVDAKLATGDSLSRQDEDDEVGSTLGIYEGWAADAELRYAGSSGGVLSALSLFCLEQEGFSGVIHTAMDAAAPWLNASVVSRGRDDIRARAGSRYSPSAPVAGLQTLHDQPGRYVFVGKPCDTSAVMALARSDQAVAQQVGAVLTFFCAGTPSTRGTLELLNQLQTDKARIESVTYRGQGWPGTFRVVERGQPEPKELSYEASWGHLTAYRPLRCNLCPDGVGRVADVACGDAWHHHHDDGDHGRSLILVRTERGRRLLESAIRAGYVSIQPATADDVSAAQANLVGRRRLLFGRLLALSLIGSPTPRYRGFHLLRGWTRARLWDQFTSVAGTLRRASRRRWYRRRPPTSDTLNAERV